MEPKNNPKTIGLIAGGIAVALIVIVIAALNIHSGSNVMLNLANKRNSAPGLTEEPPNNFGQLKAKDKITKFNSEEDFKSYLDQAEKSGGTPFFGFGRGGAVAQDLAVPQTKTMGTANESASTGPGAPVPSRVSTTNVQVLGIDEPDVIKTNGSQIYFSPEQMFIRPMMDKPIPMSASGV